MAPRLRNGSVVRLLDIDPDLGSGLSGERRDAARRDVIGLVRILPPGPWSRSDHRRFDPSERGFIERRPDRTWLLHSDGLRAVADLYRRAPAGDVVPYPEYGGA